MVQTGFLTSDVYTGYLKNIYVGGIAMSSLNQATNYATTGITVRSHTLDSREVAEMVGKEHKNLLRDIAVYTKNMMDSSQLKVEPSDFFQKSSYFDTTGRMLPCYLVTRKGCEFIANKLTGHKGTLFTAAYITRFHEMEQVLLSGIPSIIKTRAPRSKPVDIIFRQRLNMARDFSKVTGVPLGIAVAKAITDAEKLTGEDYTHWKLALPERADETQVPHLNATQLGALIGLTAQDMNRRLEAAGFQSRDGKCWRLTVAGKSHGEEYPYERNGHSDYAIRWRESAAEAVVEVS